MPKKETTRDELYSNQSISAKESAHIFENTSGKGSSAILPPEIRGWNWGAFLLPLFWSASNKVWMGVGLSLVAGVFSRIEVIGWPIALIISAVLGAKGNEWAWKNKKWDSIEHFKQTQKTWRNWGIGITVVFAIILGLLWLTFFSAY